MVIKAERIAPQPPRLSPPRAVVGSLETITPFPKDRLRADTERDRVHVGHQQPPRPLYSPRQLDDQIPHLTASMRFLMGIVPPNTPFRDTRRPGLLHNQRPNRRLLATLARYREEVHHQGHRVLLGHRQSLLILRLSQEGVTVMQMNRSDYAPDTRLLKIILIQRLSSIRSGERLQNLWIDAA